MEQRILFPRSLQRKFFDRVKYNLRVPSLRRILQFGFEVPYPTLKKYYSGKLLIPRGFFDNLCRVAKINPSSLNFEVKSGNWGQVLGGKKGIKSVQKKYFRELKKWRKLGWLNSPINLENNQING